MRRLKWWAFAAAALACQSVGPGNARAQELADYDYTNLSFRGVGFAYGRIWPSKVDPTTSYTLRADLGYLGPSVRITPSFTYWSSQLRVRELAELANKLNQLPALQAEGVQLNASDLGTVDWSDLSVGIDAQVVWTAPLQTLTYIGGGVAFHALNGRGDAIARTFVEDLLDSTTPGFALMAGIENQPHPRIRFFGEARYTMLSDVHYPELKIGAALMWPARATAQGGQ
jgi:hypothetical protein